MSEYSVQQQKIISQFRQANNLGFVISDDEVVSIMQKEMQKTGRIYPGFENLAVSKKGNKETKKLNQPTPMNSNNNLFGVNGVKDLLIGVTLERSSNNYATMTPSQSQSDAINFLKDITAEADTIVKERENEAGALSNLVNTWQEIFNNEYAKSTVKKEISKTKQDLILLEKAAKGEPISYDFIGNPEISTFEETFRNTRGVVFNEKNIQECQEKAQNYAQVKTAVEMINRTKSNLSFATKGDVASQMSPENASQAIIDAFKLSGVNSKEEINKTLKAINEKYKDHPDVKKYGGDFRIAKNKQGNYVIYRTAQNGYPAEATNEELKLIASELSSRLDKSLATALGVEYNDNATPEELAKLTQNTLEKYQKDYEESFKNAYGKKDLKVLSEQYVQKQQQGVANIEMGLNIASMALMVVSGGVVTTSGWALKGSLALKGTTTGAKVVKGLRLVDKAKKGVKIAQGFEKVQKVASPVIMANMTLRPTELLEQLSSENGMSAEEWQTWSEGVLQNSVYMAAGMGVSKAAEQGAAIYKTKALVNTLKKAGKSTDEIAAMVKANPVKFPNEIVKSFKKIDTLAKTLQVSNEVALDISSTYLLNKVMDNGDVSSQDWINSVAFAISGGVLQKQFAHLNTASKVKYIHDAFKEYGVTKEEAQNILKAMDSISEGKIRVKKEQVLENETRVPRGISSEEEVLINEARIENPAETVVGKVKDQWQQADLNTSIENNPVDLFNFDSDADVRTSAPAVNGDVTSLVLTGKLKEKLTQHYEELGNVFKDIAKNHRADFNALTKECGQDKQKFADGVIKILSDELGMQGYEPKIEFADINGVDGLANWPKGTIQISNNANNAKKLIEIISHEFTHMLQYRDIIAQYGEQGLREVVMNDNSIPTQNKEAKIKEILESPFTAKLLDNYNNLKNSEEGSLNEYLTRIYKNEFANPIDPDTDLQGYVNQATEREAYNLASQKLGNNVDGLENIYVGNGNWQVEEGEIQVINGKKFRINSDGTITRLNPESLPAGISSGMSDAEFNIQGKKLCQRADGTESPAAKALLESIRNSELENNSYDVNNFRLEDFRKISRDYKNNLLSDEMLGYAKELVDCIPKGKDEYLIQSTEYSINRLITNQLELAKPEARQKILNAAKKLFSHPNVRNGVVDDIIGACTEGNYKDGYTFNQDVFDRIYATFEIKIKNRESESDYSYSLMVSEIAKNGIYYEKDANGNYVKRFDDIGFKIGMILPESDPYGHYVHYDLTRDRNTEEIDLHNIDQDTQNYITRKAEENHFQAKKEQSEYNWRTDEYETKIYHDDYAETLRNLCTVDGKLDVQNCFAVDYMMQNLKIQKSEVVKILEKYRNQDGILDMTMLRLIKNNQNDSHRIGVLRTLEKLGQDPKILYGIDGKIDQDILSELQNSTLTRSMTLREKDYYSRYEPPCYYDISKNYMTDGKIDFDKLKIVESELRGLIKDLHIGVNNAFQRCAVTNLYNTIKENPDKSTQIIEAAKKGGVFALAETSDSNGKGIDLENLYYYASLPDDLYKLIQDKSWLIPFVKGEPLQGEVSDWNIKDLTSEDRAILATYGLDIDYSLQSRKSQYNRKSEVSEQSQNMLENTVASLDTTLGNADLSRGIELEYSRDQFENDIVEAVKDLSQARANDILNAYGLTLKNGKIEGVITKPQVDAPQNLANIEQKIKQCIEKFQNNRVLTQNSELNAIYASLTNDFPEFAMLVGKIGSDGQRVDVTVLKQMQSLVNNSQYKNLSTNEQKMAKLTLMLRAFDEVDSTPNITAKSFTTDNDGIAINAKHKRYKNGDFAWAILERFNLTDAEKYAITDLVAHSGWSREYNEGVVDIGIAKDYNPEWIKRNGVKPYPDINPENNANKVAVNTRFGTLKLSKLIEDIINPDNNIDTREIEAVQKRVYQNMQMVNSVTAKDLEPYWETQIIDGVECQVIDLRKTKLPDDFYLMGHFTEHGVSNLYNLLSNKNDKVFFSNSLLKANSVSTFAGRTEGIISEFDNRNVAETHRYNIDSGFGKSYNDFVETMYGTGKRDIKNIVIENLGLSNEEYGLLMEQIVAKRLNELDDYYNINGRYLSKQEIVDAHIAAYENMLKSQGEQNEITILNQTPIAFVYSASKTYQGQCPFSMKNSPLKRVIIFP